MQHMHMQITQKFQSNNSYNYVQMTTVTVTDINLNKFAVVYFGNQCECTWFPIRHVQLLGIVGHN